MVIWIVGLSASGKTTLGLEMYKLLKDNEKWVFLDGDTVRTIMGEDLGHSIEERTKNAYRMTRLCKILELQGINVIACVLSISQENRDYNRNYFEKYKEVFIEVPMEKLMQRDNKKLYQNALEKKIENVIGVDIPFERPLYSDYVFGNSEEGIDFTEKSIEIIKSFGLKLNQRYPYTSENRFENPEKYQYTTYLGTSFLESYENNRNSVMNKIKINIGNMENDTETIFSWVDTLEDSLEKENLIRSSMLLKEICKSLSLEKVDERIYQLIRKFEVSKKIYTSYNKETWLKVGEEFADLNNYLLFDIALVHTYYSIDSKQKKMICVNAMLKLNDLIISILHQDLKKEQLRVLLYCLEHEKNIYNHLKEGIL